MLAVLGQGPRPTLGRGLVGCQSLQAPTSRIAVHATQTLPACQPVRRAATYGHAFSKAFGRNCVSVCVCLCAEERQCMFCGGDGGRWSGAGLRAVPCMIVSALLLLRIAANPYLLGSS